ncbi:FAD-binding domain-containing protein [Agrocybe pediades]|nr:FAD-binding domain-containing protein [Agrocybe pediades]
MKRYLQKLYKSSRSKSPAKSSKTMAENSIASGTQAQVLTKESGEAFVEALRRNSTLSVLEAKYVVFPTQYPDIPPIIAHASSLSPPLEIAVKCGGAHSSTWASSAGGLVIDLGKLNKVTVSSDKKTVTVQGGARWGDVYSACQEASIDVVGGPFWFVGVGGYLTGGGYSPFTPQYGMAIDNIIDATVVLANGNIVKTSPTEEPDLFWAIRGGGNQFGIVVEFTLKAIPYSGPYTMGAIGYAGSEIDNVIKVVQEWKTTYTPKEKLNITYNRPGPHFKPSITVLPWVSEDKDDRSKEVLAPFRALNPAVDTCKAVRDMLAVSHGADAMMKVAPPKLIIRGTLITDLYPDMMLDVWQKWVAFTEENPDARATSILWELSGADRIADVASDATAFHARDPHFWVAIQGRSISESSEAVMRSFVAKTANEIRQFNTRKAGKDAGFFLNFAQGDETLEEVHGPNLPKLKKLKAKYDPKGLWRKGIYIEPDFN